MPSSGFAHESICGSAHFIGALMVGLETRIESLAGAAKARIETARRLFSRILFNADTTEAGRDAIGWYHEKKSNDDRNIGLGPNHDWSSHGADNFGLMCIHYDQPEGAPPPRQR
jgi:phage terminase large subunit